MIILPLPASCLRMAAALVLIWLRCSAHGLSQADMADSDFFEQEVRPVLLERCVGCHGSAKQAGGLRVDQRESLLTGGDSGAAVVPGNSSASLLFQAIRHINGLEMPPDEEPLTDRSIAAFARWIDRGAPWPDSMTPISLSTLDTPNDHWAFQPVTKPGLPVIEEAADWIRTPVDAFILAKLREHGLSPSVPADRRSLVRRVYYTLTGLPPSAAEVERFVNDQSTNAYANLVEALLESSQYGEHWARRWLDVARYSDTKGYVYGREERFWVHAWSYRDWVVSAFNEDMPYNRFLMLQLAADQIEDRRPTDLAAMGFLTLGRRFLGVERDIIDDRIDVVCRGTMGLTVACARCHDHKYDPIPTADYYALYGVFDSCAEKLVPLAETGADSEFGQELERRQTTLASRLAEARQESSARVRSRIADYLFAQSELHKYPANGFDQIFQKEDLLPAFVRRWERFLRDANRDGDPNFVAWHAFFAIANTSFSEQAATVTRDLQSRDLPTFVARAFATPPTSFREVCERYATILSDIDAQWQARTESLTQTLADPVAESLRQVLYGPRAPCEVPDGPIVLAETYFDSGTVTELWKLQGEVDRWIINAPQPAPHALTLVDRQVPNEPRVFVRGNPLTQGIDVPRQFLAVLSQTERQPFQHGSGRFELAAEITHPQNPLTARVMVNRVWAAHFGEGLVSTPSDFGTRAEKPSHPALLDWLAASFVEHGWSLKDLHRWIVLSSTFQQSSQGGSERVNESLAIARKLDPSNRLLWRMNSKRLTFEEFRDSLFAASDELDEAVGGKPQDLFAQPFMTRRTLYGLVDRQFLPGTLRMFDFANPDLHVPQRSETTVPGQALFFLNHPLMLQRARALATTVRDIPNLEQRVTSLFRKILQREPTVSEVADSLIMAAAVSQQTQESSSVASQDWQYGFGAVDESAARVQQFTPLPQFTGQAWQGGSNYPDAQLGWLQLTANGGHPGDDRGHASIRRWTAPQAGTLRLQSQLQHEPSVGDGIRAFVIHSGRGIIASAKIHHQTRELSVDQLEVLPGDTLDFVVDIDEVLNSDQYLWHIQLEPVTARHDLKWDSMADFPREIVEHLDGWEQLAQVLLCSNEFLFVD